MDLKTAQKLNFDGFEIPIILWDSRLWFLLKIDLELEVFVLAPTRNSNNVQLANRSCNSASVCSKKTFLRLARKRFEFPFGIANRIHMSENW